jgi:hypothetical protein
MLACASHGVLVRWFVPLLLNNQVSQCSCFLSYQYYIQDSLAPKRSTWDCLTYTSALGVERTSPTNGITRGKNMCPVETLLDRE